MQIQTQLCADVEELRTVVAPRLTGGCDVIVLLALGIEPAAFIPFAKAVTPGPQVLLADCYGILGFSATEGRNIELMEAGRGREYGGTGGDGGQGVVVVAFAGGGVLTSAETLPSEGVTAHLVVAGGGSDIGAVLARQSAVTYYGGVAKATYRYVPYEERFEPIPYFSVSTLAKPDSTVGISSFTADAAGSVKTLLDQAPAGARVEVVALFPCFMRGKNEYGVNNVEPDAVARLLPGIPIFGMFCHGELGPRRCMGFDSTEPPQQSCTLHSMTTIVAVHAAR